MEAFSLEMTAWGTCYALHIETKNQRLGDFIFQAPVTLRFCFQYADRIYNYKNLFCNLSDEWQEIEYLAQMFGMKIGGRFLNLHFVHVNITVLSFQKVRAIYGFIFGVLQFLLRCSCYWLLVAIFGSYCDSEDREWCSSTFKTFVCSANSASCTSLLVNSTPKVFTAS